MNESDPHPQYLGAISSMADFGAQALEWNSFFSTVAQVSGGLVGLVFVALTFNGRLVEPGSFGLRQLARQTFADLLDVLIVSSMMLVPKILPVSIGFIVIILAGICILRILRTFVAMLKADHDRRVLRQLLQRFVLSLAGNVALLVAGIVLSLPPANPTKFWTFLFGGVLMLMISGTRSAWLLVVPEDDDKS